MSAPSQLNPTTLTAEKLTDQLIAEAQRVYDDADREVIAKITSDVVEELWTDDIKVTSFLPVLAMRRVRDMIDEALGS